MGKKLNADIIESMFHEISVAILAIDNEDETIYYFNDIVCRDMEMTADYIEGKSYKTIFSADFIKSYEKLHEECQDGDVHTIVYYWASKLIWEQISAKQFVWEDGKPVILMTITNITEVARAEYKYEQLAYFDSITNLPNGKKLEEDINKLADIETVSLIYFQVIGYDRINELYGFDVGDSLILQIRDWLIFSQKRDAHLYRGTQGMIMVGHQVILANAKKRAEEIVERFDYPWTISVNGKEYSIYCHVKVGILYGKYVKNEMRTMLLRTLRAPVTEGGYSIYDEEENKKAERNLYLAQALIDCVHKNMSGFSVEYHPIVDTKTEKWVGAETLCRWVTPDGTNVPPLTFIKLAENLGLIATIDDWVRETAMNECMIWGMNRKKFFLDVNFSPTQSVDKVFINRLMASLIKTGYPSLNLVMEITESQKMEFTKENIEGLKTLEEEGVVFSIDDFGTGYSSFENLIKIPASSIKTEKVFLEDIEYDEYKQYLLKMLINLAHHLDKKIICEGVEKKGQAKLLKEYGADYMQGFLFSKPLNREAFKKEVWRYENAQ